MAKPSKVCDQVQRISIKVVSAADHGAINKVIKAKLKAGHVSESFLRFTSLMVPDFLPVPLVPDKTENTIS